LIKFSNGHTRHAEFNSKSFNFRLEYQKGRTHL